MRYNNLQVILLIGLLLGIIFIGKSEGPNSLDRLRGTENQNIYFTSVAGNGYQPNDKPYKQESGPDNLDIKSAVVKKLGENHFFLNIGTNERWPIASLTKLMTAIIALEKLESNQKVFFNDKIIATEGDAGNFKIGDNFEVVELIKALMIVSSNDAAIALAENYGYNNFVDAMQIKARDLGMTNTTFFDPTGLSFLNQSTITDLEKLVIYVYNNHPKIFQFSQQQKIGSLININQFAGQSNFLGGKTGYTDDANGNLISLFSTGINNPPLLIIVLGTNDRFSETKKLLDYYGYLTGS